MYYYSENFKNDAIFESCGQFITSEPWRHATRIIHSYELMLGIEGILPIEVGNKRYKLKPNELLIIPPNIPHTGYRKTEGTVRFLWIHFTYEDFTHVRNKEFAELSENNKNNNQFSILPVYYSKMNIHRIFLMGNQLLDIYQEHVSQDYLDAYLNSMLQEINHQVTHLLKPNQVNHNSMQPIQDWIRVHAFENITLQSIAEYFNYNKNYLSRKYKGIFGFGITQQITKYRISHAKYLLSGTNLTIQEIACAVEYEDSKYFMRIFKRLENNTPSEYRHAFNQKHFNNE